MVKPKDELLDYAIKNTKMRIKHMERHGMGKNAMEEKAILQKQERIKQLRLERKNK